MVVSTYDCIIGRVAFGGTMSNYVIVSGLVLTIETLADRLRSARELEPRSAGRPFRVALLGTAVSTLMEVTGLLREYLDAVEADSPP